ncbi:phage tail protein [Flexibacterium corallicola]|uniref:phage tail protein n=1 Tax=Flexibacterium corallicola TaxID=3037259 RepID=UPI00286F1691|nr:tail fiber protein [Pseudovibrio sp. M1P-2-3]
MSEPYISQISIFPLFFAVRDWAYCDGQLIAVSQNVALFSLVGTTFGGNGISSFGLPEMRGRVAVQRNTNGTYFLGQKAGIETQTLVVGNLPAHTHSNLFFGATQNDGSEDPGPSMTLASPKVGDIVGDGYVRPDSNAVTLANSGSRTVSAGYGRNFSVMDPFMCMSYEIALKGDYPSRSG